MYFVIGFISNKISEILESRDTRLDHLPLSSPLSAILIAAGYMYFVKVGGPSFMSKRKPFALQKVIAVYNLIQIIINAALVLYGLYLWRAYKPNFNVACQPIDWSTNMIAMEEAKCTYYYYCLKLLDLCDTVFFVLKKNTRQISFLHVYHHLALVIFTNKALGWSPGGQFAIVGMLNCTVHTFMYTYYLLSVLKPEIKGNVNLKKKITTMQMVQFVILIFFFGLPLLSPNCALPKFFLFEIVVQNVIMLCLFSNFYYRNYCVENEKNKEL